MRVVLDADVLIGALDGSDPRHAEARALFTAWEEQNATRSISAVNLTEVLVAPAADRRSLRRARSAIAALRVGIHERGQGVAVEAARLRGAYPISLPDAYHLATAREAGGTVVSFDRNVVHAAETEGIALVRTSPVAGAETED